MQYMEKTLLPRPCAETCLMFREQFTGLQIEGKPGAICDLLP